MSHLFAYVDPSGESEDPWAATLADGAHAVAAVICTVVTVTGEEGGFLGAWVL